MFDILTICKGANLNLDKYYTIEEIRYMIHTLNTVAIIKYNDFSNTKNAGIFPAFELKVKVSYATYRQL
jgi:hypothetical protein